jgi:hypothetical protein
MTAHVIRSHGKEKRGPDAVFGKQAAQARHALLGAPVSVHIDAQT